MEAITNHYLYTGLDLIIAICWLLRYFDRGDSIFELKNKVAGLFFENRLL